VASCEVHINKPDAGIYQELLRKYDLRASECVFIDDNLENVQSAFQLGITGVLMRGSVGTLIRNLASCNVTLR
jgi:putative hydrolase of the HAD superfamily